MKQSAAAKPYVCYPAVVSAGELAELHAILRGRKAKGGRPVTAAPNLFSHLAMNEMEGNFHFQTKIGGNGTTYHHLRDAENGQSVPYGDFAELILDALERVSPADVDGTTESNEWTDRIAGLQDRLTKELNAIAEIERQLADVDPARWPSAIVGILAKREDGAKALADELAEAKLLHHSTARRDSLSTVKSLIDTINGLADGGEKSAALERLQRRLPLVLSRIVVAIEETTSRTKWVHVRMEYHGGHKQRLALRYGSPPPASERFAGAW